MKLSTNTIMIAQKYHTQKQAENGLQLRSSENGKTAVSVALWIEIAVILNWR